jgi:2-polyprenyl-6-hydroxyphenyl methylase/3-demethylubiquinone-9 3-methyltransferase
MIKVAQDWRLTKIIDTESHSWNMFVKPTELEEALRRHGLRLGEITGLGPRANKLVVLRSYRQARRGRITFGRLSELMDVGEVKATGVSYMGYAIKND